MNEFDYDYVPRDCRPEPEPYFPLYETDAVLFEKRAVSWWAERVWRNRRDFPVHWIDAVPGSSPHYGGNVVWRWLAWALGENEACFDHALFLRAVHTMFRQDRGETDVRYLERVRNWVLDQYRKYGR